MIADTGSLPGQTNPLTPEVSGGSLPNSAETLLRLADVRTAVNHAYEAPAEYEISAEAPIQEVSPEAIVEQATIVSSTEAPEVHSVFTARDPETLYSDAAVVGMEFEGFRSGVIDNVAA